MPENTNVQETQDSILTIEGLSGVEKTRYLALRREIALHDHMNAYAEYRKEGREEGLIKALKKMIKSGIDEEKAKEILGI